MPEELEKLPEAEQLVAADLMGSSNMIPRSAAPSSLIPRAQTNKQQQESAQQKEKHVQCIDLNLRLSIWRTSSSSSSYKPGYRVDLSEIKDATHLVAY